MASLQYGGISINQWNTFGYISSTKGGIWGGHKSEVRGQSGNGFIGDLYGIIGDKHAKSVVYGPSLETKPMFDMAAAPPPIVFDVLMELTCTESVLKGVVGALKLVAMRSVRGILSYVGI